MITNLHTAILLFRSRAYLTGTPEVDARTLNSPASGGMQTHLAMMTALLDSSCFACRVFVLEDSGIRHGNALPLGCN